MSDHIEMTKTTPLDFLMATVGGLAPPLIPIILITLLVIGIQHGLGTPDPAPLADQAVRDRIKPYGLSVAVDPNAPHVDRTGEAVYADVCSGCHETGALGSPKFKEKADWGKRIAKGYETLLDHAFKGFNKMPMRGGEPDLSDLEVARALVYMANAAGANFQPTLKKEYEPSAAELARGKAVYADNCASCHDTGLTGAQKLSDVKAWGPLLKEGKDALYAAAINGTYAAAPKGGNDKLSDADTRNAVEYMVAQVRAAMPAKPAAK